MNITNLIAQADSEFRSARAMGEAILAKVKAEGRDYLTVEETREANTYYEQAETAKRNKDALKVLFDEETAADKRAADVHSTGVKAPVQRYASVHVGSEARTYHRGNDPEGKNFLLDVIRGQMFGDPNANERLARHMREEVIERPSLDGYRQERANDATSNFTGLTVPQYLTDMVALPANNMRPFVDASMNHHELPSAGMSVNISKITTGTLATLQSGGENNSLATQAAADTLLTIPVQTAGGWVNVSRQAVERGTGIDQALMQDLFNKYYTDMDNQVLNQATTGGFAQAVNIDVVTAGFTPQVLYSKILGGASSITSNLLNVARPTHVTMHPRRWDWLSAQVTATWPLVSNQTDNGPGAGLGVISSTEYGSGVVGKLPNGLLVVSDANVPTNLTADAGTGEDALLVTAQQECHLWTDASQPAFIRAEQPNSPSLGILLVIYGYYAYTFNRYTNSAAKLTGSALTVPNF